MAAAVETETTLTAEAAATLTAEAAAVGWWRHRQGNIKTTMTATTGDEDFNAGQALCCC